MSNKNIIIEAGLGDMFSNVAKKAKEIAQTVYNHGKNIQFEFNGITCIVNADTNLDNLYRHYSDSFIMEWKEIGPVCADQYTEDIQQELNKRRIDQEKRQEEEMKVYREKEEKKKQELAKKVEGTQIQLKDETLWNNQKEINTDPYGAGILRYAKNWALLMQTKIDTTKDIQFQVAAIAKKTSHEADIESITGFMYGAAVSVLSSCWIYGEELRKWHNKEYGYEGNGTVNPAVITIG